MTASSLRYLQRGFWPRSGCHTIDCWHSTMAAPGNEIISFSIKVPQQTFASSGMTMAYSLQYSTEMALMKQSQTRLYVLYISSRMTTTELGWPTIWCSIEQGLGISKSFAIRGTD